MESKKWKIVIVDDEFRIAMLIQKLIHWDKLNMECAAAVNKGDAVLQMIQEQDIDVVITDIRMPVVNGFDLIQKAEEMGKDIRFVVVSGYKEFEYAHKALQHGVSDYLLKPINEEELNRVLQKIVDELREKDEQSLEKQTLEDEIQKSKKIIRRNFLRDIIDQEQTIVGEDVVLNGDVYRGIDIKLDYADYNRHDERQDQLTMEKVSALAEKNLFGAAEEVLICAKENLHIFCMLNYSSSKSREIMTCIAASLIEIKEYLIGFEQYEVTIGVGSERSSIGEMRFSLQEARIAAGNRIKLGTGRLLHYESMVQEPSSAAEPMIEQMKTGIRDSVGSFLAEPLDRAINAVFSTYVMEDGHNFSNCYEIAASGTEFFFSLMNEMNAEFPKEKEDLLQKIAHCYTIVQLKTLLKTELRRYLELMRVEMDAKAAKPVRKAQQYVEDHFAEKITLEDLAEHVGLNPVYFSVLFKNETGLNFSVYLTNVRMEHAKEMIRNTNETISEVGQRVGYKDTRYFSQTFAKTVGVKPALYRKLHS